MNDKPKPICNCTPEGDIARERRPTLHQEHCAILKWWNEKIDRDLNVSPDSTSER